MELKYQVFDDSIMYVETGRVRISCWNEMAFSWDCTISFFLNFGLMQETHMTLCCYRATFSRKIFLSPKLEKRIKSGPKQGFIEEFIEEFSHELLLNLFDNEKLYY